MSDYKVPELLNYDTHGWGDPQVYGDPSKSSIWAVEWQCKTCGVKIETRYSLGEQVYCFYQYFKLSSSSFESLYPDCDEITMKQALE